MNKVYNFLLALYPIVSGYGFSPQADFGILIITMIGFLYYVTAKPQGKLRLPDGYLLFFIVTMIFSLFLAHHIYLRLILFTVNLCLACSLGDYFLLFKYYEKIMIVCCAFFFVQLVSSVLLNIHIVGIFSFLPTIYEGIVDVQDVQSESERFASFFMEPSYFAQYLFPYIVIRLFSFKKKDIKKAIYISIILLLVRSGNGMLLLIVIWGAWFFTKNTSTLAKGGVAVVVLLGWLLLVFSGSDFFDLVLSRVSEFQSYDGEEVNQSSGFIRFFRGYYAFSDFPLFNKWFGSSSKVATNIIESNVFFIGGETFINGTQTLLCYHGIISCVLFFRHLTLYCWHKYDTILTVMVICSFVLMLGESYFLCSRMLLCSALMYLYIVSPYSNYKKTVLLK